MPVRNYRLSFLDEMIYGTSELPLPEMLVGLGIDVQRRAAANAQDKGGKPVEGDLPRVDFGARLKDDDSGLAVQRVSRSRRGCSIAGLSAGDTSSSPSMA